MKIRTLLLLVALIMISVFTFLNWSAFMTPTTLSLGVADVEAPLGLVMLGLLIFLLGLFLVFVVYLQTSVFFEARRHARELQASRELARQAEVSRFVELRVFIEAELKKQTNLEAESQAAVLARLDQFDRDLRLLIEQSANSLSAYIGELEDLLDKKAGHPPA